ncbi:MAG: inositol monophosphatase family protein, partial [Candidatus Omnitrophota bacterium]
MIDLKRVSQVAEECAREAGGYIIERMGTLKEVSHKTGRNNLVTDVDKMSEKIIIARIKEVFPGHSILAEESGYLDRKTNEALWIIDPLDGTTNYAHGFPFFCVSIGVAVNNIIMAGVVY